MLKKYNWIVTGVNHFNIFVIVILVFQTLDTVVSMLLPQFISRIIDAGLDSQDVSLIMEFMLISIGLYVLSHLFALFSEFIFTELAKRISYNLKQKLLTKIFILPGETVNTHNDKLLSLFMNDIGIIERLVSNGIPMFISNLLFLIVISTVLLFYNYILFIVILMVMLLILLSQIYFNKKITQRSKLVMEAYDDSVFYIRGTLHSILYSIGMGLKDYVLGKYMPLEEKSLEANRKRGNTFKIAATVPSVIISVGNVLLLGIGAMMVINGQTSIGILTVFVYYSNQIIGPIKGVTNYVAGWKQAKVSIERVELIMKAEEVD
ncbi:ABC transporter ATP-binding protein [Paenibacillus sp. FSL H7-0442]|uniref:ABC transporter ATP-binding protein n=1 Tax=Paenibacillus sp. FSL H7-0442 TaxID=2921435 RepID=UPI0031594A4F